MDKSAADMGTKATQERTVLKPVDHEAFFAALDAPPAPTERLRAAFKIGLLKGQIDGPGPDFFEPMGEDELSLWEKR